MSSISSMDTVRPPRSPSPASSPTLEDDIVHNKSWLTHDSIDNKRTSPREHHADLHEPPTDPNSYSPMSDQEAETRRVEQVRRLCQRACICELTHLPRLSGNGNSLKDTAAGLPGIQARLETSSCLQLC